jgi:hypothetical protein
MEVSRRDGHLIVSAVRVLAHKRGTLPTPEEVAELLEWAPEILRLKAMALVELGALRQVVSAYENHLEVGDLAVVERLDEIDSADAMDAALADFEVRKREEAEKMSRLFEGGDLERRRQEKMKGMEEGLFKTDRKKPVNPFGDDD